ncbi:hypothetical protein Hanom_Chr11g00999961 [Helianthus anomalus]
MAMDSGNGRFGDLGFCCFFHAGEAYPQVICHLFSHSHCFCICST